MAAVEIVSLFLSFGLLTPSIRSAIIAQQSTGHVHKNMFFLSVCFFYLFV